MSKNDTNAERRTSESFASTGLNRQAYELEWKRTKPNYVVFIPAPDGNPRWCDNDFFVLNEQIIVVSTNGGDLLAFWTSWGPELKFLRVVVSRSEDGGKTWSKLQIIDGPGSEDSLSACWQVPIVTASGRIYCIYNKITVENNEFGQPHAGGTMRCRYSDDDGHTWSNPVDLSFFRRLIDNPDPNVPISWVAWRQPEWDSAGRPIVPFTRWASFEAGVPYDLQYSQCELMVFENINSDPSPEELEINWLPEKEPVTVPHEEFPDKSFAQEPSVVSLPDGRLFMAMRTSCGSIWYTVSDDNGATWRKAEVMRYFDSGDEVLNPVAPAPIYRMKNGKFLLCFNNNDGYVYGAKDRWENRNRRPGYLAVGEFRADAHQPVWWSRPKKFVDNDGIALHIEGHGNRFDAFPYNSLTEVNSERILWYPDRKHFLLGKIITDEWLSDLEVPK